MRRADAEAGEHQGSRRGAARAEAVGIELLPGTKMPRGAAGGRDVEPVGGGIGDGRGHQVVRLEERPVRPGAFQPHALEPRADEVGRRAILFRVGEAAPHRVAGEEEQIGAEIVLADRLVLRRPLLRRQMNRARQARRDDEVLLHAGDYAPESRVACELTSRGRPLDPQVGEPGPVVRQRRHDVVDRVARRPVVREVRRRVHEHVGRRRCQQRRPRQRDRARLHVLQRPACRHPEPDDGQAERENRYHRGPARRQRVHGARRRHREAQRVKDDEQPAQQQQPAADG